MQFYNTIDEVRNYDLRSRKLMGYPISRCLCLLLPYLLNNNLAPEILNIGCETGLLASVIAVRFPGIRMYGLDNNPHFIKVAEENNTFLQLLANHARIEYCESGFSQLPVEDNAADIVIAYNTIYRCENPVGLLTECDRVCKPDGIIFFNEIIKDAEKQTLHFISSWLGDSREEFERTLKLAFTYKDLQNKLLEADLQNWSMYREKISVIISNKQLIPPSLLELRSLLSIELDVFILLYQLAANLENKDSCLVDCSPLTNAACIGLQYGALQTNESALVIKINSDETKAAKSVFTYPLLKSKYKEASAIKIKSLTDSIDEIYEGKKIRMLYFNGSDDIKVFKEFFGKISHYFHQQIILIIHNFNFNLRGVDSDPQNHEKNDFLKNRLGFQFICSISHVGIFKKL